MQEKNWPNFSKNLISKVGRILSSGKINYIDGPKNLKKNFQNLLEIDIRLLFVMGQLH